MNPYHKAIAVMVLMASLAPLGAQTLTDIGGDYPFVLQIPAGWDVDAEANAETGGTTIQISPDDDPPPAVMQIHVIPQQGGDQLLLGQVITAAETAMAANGVAPTVIDKTVYDKGPLLGEIRTYRFDIPEREVIHRSAYIASENYLFTLAMTARAELADEYLALFDRALASFEER